MLFRFNFEKNNFWLGLHTPDQGVRDQKFFFSNFNILKHVQYSEFHADSEYVYLAAYFFGPKTCLIAPPPFSKIACYPHRISCFRSYCSQFWLFRSKFHKEIAVSELKIHLTRNCNTESRLHSQEKWKFLRYSSTLDQI